MPDKAHNTETFLNVNTELFSLNPSTLVTLFEIDVSEIMIENGLLKELVASSDSVFRFHNCVQLFRGQIIWNGLPYDPAPIKAEGFDLSSKGTLPVPRLSLTVNEEGVPLIATLRSKIAAIGDIIGAKVTRIRTFARFLDEDNFKGSTPPKDYAPDPNAELPRDIYYIDRKSTETKFLTEYELASIFDLEGIKLPGRVVFADRCSWCYRGEGCLYEYRGEIAGEESVPEIFKGAELPSVAPPVATVNDELIHQILGLDSINNLQPRRQWKADQKYQRGDFVWIKKNNIRYYFVAKVSNPPAAPPNSNYWIADECSHSLDGCRLRWYTLAENTKPSILRLNLITPFGRAFDAPRTLPFGGFPAANKVS